MSQCLWSDCRGNNAQATSNYSQVTCEKNANASCSSSLPPNPALLLEVHLPPSKTPKTLFSQIQPQIGSSKKTCKIGSETKNRF